MRFLLSFLLYSGMLSTIIIQSEKFYIKGTIDKSFDGQLAILSIKDDYLKIIHSDTSIINQGRFSFDGNEYLNNLSTIIIKNNEGTQTQPVLGLMLENGIINVSFSEDRPYLSGTPLNDMFMGYRDSIRYFVTKISEIESQWDNNTIIISTLDIE